MFSLLNNKEISREGIDRIIIRGTNWVGDVIMSLPAVFAIRNSYRQARISVLAKPWVADLYRFCPAVDEVIIYQSPGVHEGVRGKYRLARELNKQDFQLAILLQNAIEAAIITKLAGIPRRAGYNTDGRGLLLTHAVVKPRQIAGAHQSSYYLYLVNKLGCQVGDAGALLEVDEKHRLKAAEMINKWIGEGAAPLVGMAVGAAYGPAKKWFPERFAAVADRLIEEFGARVFIMGSREDRPQAEAVLKAMEQTAYNLAGETNLADAIALIEKLSIMIANDSGLMHIAGALNIPTIAIFGSTNPVATSPLGSHTEVICKAVDCSPCLKKTCPGDFRCMDSIKADEVYLSAQKMLSPSLANARPATLAGPTRGTN